MVAESRTIKYLIINKLNKHVNGSDFDFSSKLYREHLKTKQYDQLYNSSHLISSIVLGDL